MDARLREYERHCHQEDLEACYRAFKDHKRIGTPLEEIDPYILDIGTRREMEIQEPLDFRTLLHRVEPQQFNAIRFNNGISISIQASLRHGSKPQADLDKYDYVKWEIHFYNPRREIWLYDYDPDDPDDQQILQKYLQDPNAIVEEPEDGTVKISYYHPFFKPGGLLYGCPHQNIITSPHDDVVGGIPTEILQDIVDFCRARFGLRESSKRRYRYNPLDTSGIICDFCGKPGVTHVYFTKPFQLGGLERSNFASCGSCAKSISNRNITALVNRAVRRMPLEARRSAKSHFKQIYNTFFIKLTAKREMTPADIFDLQTARATAKHQKCAVRFGHPVLGECSVIALLEVGIVDADEESGRWMPSCIICASGVLGLETAEDIIDHPAIRTLGESRRNPIHETRLLGSIVLGIWGGGDENEARQASRLATRQIVNSILSDLADIRRIFVNAYAKASGQLGFELKLKAIWENAASQNEVFGSISYDALMGRTKKKPKPTTKKPTRKKKAATRKKRPARTRRRRTGVCQIDGCDTDSRGKPLCRKHYYEAIGKPFIEVCQHPGCDQPSRGQPLCREHYYGGRGRRRGRRRPRMNPMSKKKYDTLWTNFIMKMEEIGTDNAEQLVNLVGKCDPTHNSKYVAWIGKQVIKRNIVLPADIDDINLLLTEFHNKKHLLPVEYRNIDSYKVPGDLYATMEQFVGAVTGRSPVRDFILSLRRTRIPGMQLLSPHKKGSIVYDVIKITKAKAASDLAQGTAWCVKDPSLAESYLKEAPMYLVAENKEPFALIYQRRRNDYDGERITTEIRDKYDRTMTPIGLSKIKPIIRRFTVIPTVDPSSPSYLRQYKDVMEYQEQALGETEAAERFKQREKQWDAYVRRQKELDEPFAVEEEEEPEEEDYDLDDPEFWGW